MVVPSWRRRSLGARVRGKRFGFPLWIEPVRRHRGDRASLGRNRSGHIFPTGSTSGSWGRPTFRTSDSAARDCRFRGLQSRPRGLGPGSSNKQLRNPTAPAPRISQRRWWSGSFDELAPSFSSYCGEHVGPSPTLGSVTGDPTLRHPLFSSWTAETAESVWSWKPEESRDQTLDAIQSLGAGPQGISLGSLRWVNRSKRQIEVPRALRSPSSSSFLFGGRRRARRRQARES